MPGAQIEIIPNPGPANQPSLLLDNEHAVAVAQFLRDDPALRFDYCSNVTGVDWLDRTVKKKVKVKKVVEGVEKEVEETTGGILPGYLEAVYHLYSMALKHGPVIIRLRTTDRADRRAFAVAHADLAQREFQEREIFDLYGIHFDGHPDLRRILMWDEFKDYPDAQRLRRAGRLRIRADAARRSAGKSESSIMPRARKWMARKN